MFSTDPMTSTVAAAWKRCPEQRATGGGVLVDDLVNRGYHPLVYRYLLL
jgi:hypothetical protein